LKLTIIIATHARPESLTRLLASLAPQINSHRHEIFIAENGTPGTTPLESTVFPVIHLHNPSPGKCRVQNAAIAQARGELLVFLDDDLIVADGYLNAVESFFNEHQEYAAMKGRILPADDPYIEAGAMAPYLDLPLVDHGDRVVEVRGVLGANMAFRTSALRIVGAFDERLGPGAAGHEEETEISKRLRRAGFRIGYAPEALVYHDVDPARADRARFIRIARERGYCRTLHENHNRFDAAIAVAVAGVRLNIARIMRASINRIAREERRLAVAQGILDGLRARSQSSWSIARSSEP
jgi:glucosyl-dolichyl phosphate glucuronosyltransferase